MHRHAFTDQTIFADDECGVTAFMLAVLRCATNNGVVINRRAFAHCCDARYDDMAHQLAITADGDIWSDVAEWANRDVLADFSAVFNQCGRMDGCGC